MANAARMLEEEKTIGLGIPCILLVDVSYKRWDGATIDLAKGSKVFVDTARGFAAHGDDHFMICRSEYSSLLPN